MEDLDDMIALDESRYGELARNPRTLRFFLPFSSPLLSSPLHSHHLSRSDQLLRYLPSYARSQRVAYGAGTYSSWEDQRLALMQGQVVHEGGEGGRLMCLLDDAHGAAAGDGKGEVQPPWRLAFLLPRPGPEPRLDPELDSLLQLGKKSASPTAAGVRLAV